MNPKDSADPGLNAAATQTAGSVPAARPRKFVVLAPPKRFTRDMLTPAEAPALDHAEELPPAPQTSAQRPALIYLEREMLERAEQERLALPKEAADALADAIRAAILRHFRLQVPRRSVEQLPYSIASRFLTISPGPERYAYVCAYAAAHLDRTFASLANMPHKRPARLYLNVLQSDAGDVAGQLLCGEIPLPAA